MHRQARRRLMTRRGGYGEAQGGGATVDSSTVHTGGGYGTGTSPGGPMGGGGYDGDGQGQLQFYPYLEKMRAPFAQELAQDPQLRSTLAAVAAGEYEEYPHQMLEVLMNRAAYMGGTLRQGIYGFPNVDRGRSPYGPVRTGLVNRTLGELQNSPRRMANMNSAIDDVLRGSNLAQLRTDQGSAALHDPNSMNPSGRMLIGREREVLNDWNGPGGSNAAAQWRMQHTAQLGTGALGDPSVPQAATSTPSAPAPTQVASAAPSGMDTLAASQTITPQTASAINGLLGPGAGLGGLGSLTGGLLKPQQPAQVPGLNMPQFQPPIQAGMLGAQLAQQLAQSQMPRFKGFE